MDRRLERGAQLPQKHWPQRRQWCRRFVRNVKGAAHFWQRGAAASGTQRTKQSLQWRTGLV